MKDALFQGYGGAAHTHSSGGGLLKPGDFHGQAALLIKENVTGDERNQQKALRRLKHPLVGNEIVRQTLTCLEREIACAQPTIPNGLKKHTGSGSDSDEDEASVLLQPEEFSGAAVSMLPPGEGAESVFNEPPMIGTTTSRVGNHTVLKEADPISASSTAEAATFPTLFTMGTRGGFAHTQTEATTEASQARGPPRPRTAPPHRRGRSDDGRPPPAPRGRASRNIGTRGRRPDPPAAAERRTDADMNQTMRYWQKGIYQAAGLQKSELSVGPTPPPTRPTPWPRSARPRERGRRPTPRRRPPSRR